LFVLLSVLTFAFRKIAITLSGGIDDYLQIYSETGKDCANLPEGWKKNRNFRFGFNSPG